MAKSPLRPESDAIDFLQFLYDGADGGFVELRSIPIDRRVGTPKTAWATTFRSIEMYSQKADRAEKVGHYFGVAKRGDKQVKDKNGNLKRSGGKDNLTVATALWADIDTVKLGWDMLETARAIYFMPRGLRPNALVNSGRGLHAYWVLNEPVDLTTVQGITRLEDANKVVQAIMSSDYVHNADRILRLPGTYNVKGAAKPVFPIWVFRHDRKDLDDLVDAALGFDCQLWDGKFIPKGKVPKYVPITEHKAMVTSREEGNKSFEKKWSDLWARTRYHGGDDPRHGYIGVDEAILLGTAKLYTHCKITDSGNDDYVVRQVLAEVQRVDRRGEAWDWAAEEQTIRDKLERFKAKWPEFERQWKVKKKAERDAKKAAERAEAEEAAAAARGEVVDG